MWCPHREIKYKSSSASHSDLKVYVKNECGTLVTFLIQRIKTVIFIFKHVHCPVSVGLV
jgi:hypothetical protein